MRLVKAGILLPLILAACEENPEPRQDPADACRNVLIEPVERRILRWEAPDKPAPPLPCPRAICVCGASDLLARNVPREPAGVLVERRAAPPVFLEGAHCRGVVPGNGTLGVLRPQDRLQVVTLEAGVEPTPLSLAEVEPQERVSSLYREGDTLLLSVYDPNLSCDEGRNRAVRLRGPPLPPSRPLQDREGRAVGRVVSDEKGTWVEVGEARRRIPDELAGRLNVKRGQRSGRYSYLPLTEGLLVLPDGDPPYVVRSPGRQSVYATERGPIAVRDEGVFALGPDEERPLVERQAGRDLAGEPLADGVALQKSRWKQIDDWSAVLFIDRYRSPTCELEDRVHLVDYTTREVTTLAEGPGMRSHAQFSLDKLHLVESELALRFIPMAD